MAMPSMRDLTNEDRVRAAREIDNFFDFARDVLDEPSILEEIPSGAKVEAIPKAEAEAGQRYDIETARMVATVTRQRRFETIRRGIGSTVHELGSVVTNRRQRPVPATSQRSSRAAKQVYRQKGRAGQWAVRQRKKSGDVLAPSRQNKDASKKRATKPVQGPRDSS